MTVNDAVDQGLALLVLDGEKLVGGMMSFAFPAKLSHGKKMEIPSDFGPSKLILYS